MNKSIVLVGFLILCLSGCAESKWVMVGGPHSIQEDIQLELPDGWRKWHEDAQRLVLTRDGYGIQKIIIQGRMLASINHMTKKKLNKTMLPHELVEWGMAQIMSDTNLRNQELIEQTSAIIGGQQGFQFTYQFRTKGGPLYKGTSYGYLQNEKLYTLTYEAPARHYYQEHLHTFQKILESYRLDSRPKV